MYFQRTECTLNVGVKLTAGQNLEWIIAIMLNIEVNWETGKFLSSTGVESC